MKQRVHFAKGAVQLKAKDTQLVLRNAVGVLQVDISTGGLIFERPLARGLTGLTAEAFVTTARGGALVLGGRNQVKWRTMPAGADAVASVEVSRQMDSGACLHWRIAAAVGGFVVRIGVSGVSEQVTGIGLTFPQAGKLLATASRPQALRIAYCGAHSQSLLSRSEVVPLGPKERVKSWWTTAWFDASDEAGFVLGFLEAQRFAGWFELDGVTGRACTSIESIRADGAAILWGEPLWIAPTGNVCDALQEYGRQVGRRCSRGGGKSPSGWGSWTHYADDINASQVRQNARAALALLGAGHAEPLIHVDHGWEAQFQRHRPKPIWRPRREFVSSMPTLARGLQKEGCKLGLWVVPFVINAEGPLSRVLRDTILCDFDGMPRPVIGTGCYCLDPTSPKGEAWLRRLLGRLAGWGVTHLKLDFLRVLVATDPDDPASGLTQPRNFHRSMTRVEAYRHGLGIIRDTVGPRMHLLACGAPLLPSAGLVDACRIGSDIEAVWEYGRTGIRHCAENVRCNFFWHGDVWRNDPDFVVVPQEEAEFRYWAAAAAFAGGATLVSAAMASLRSSQLELLRRFLPSLPGKPQLVKLTPHAGVTRIYQRLSVHAENVWMVAFFNSTAEMRRDRVSFFELGIISESTGLAWDVMTGCPVGRVGASWRVEVPAHDVRILCIRMVLDRPQLVGTSGHIGMEQVELSSVIWRADQNALCCERHVGRSWPDLVYLRVPKKYFLTPVRGLALSHNSRILTVNLREFRSRTLRLSFRSAP